MSESTQEASILLQMRDELTSGLNRVERGMRDFDRTSTKTTVGVRGFGSVLGSIKGTLGTLGGLWVVKKGIEGIGASVKWAASQGVSMMKLGVMLKSPTKALEYFNWAMQEANRTPFENGEMFKAVEGLSPFAKTTDDMKKYVQMAEVLATMNEEEGLKGAAFAMKEALSGDFTSLAERFNLPRSTINRLKEGKKTSAEFYEVTRLAAKEMGFGYEMVEKYSKTEIGLMSTITGTLKNWGTIGGTSFLASMKGDLQGIVDWMGKNDGAVKDFAKNLGASLGQSVKAIGQDLKAWGDEIERFKNFIEPATTAIDKWRKENGIGVPLSESGKLKEQRRNGYEFKQGLERPSYTPARTNPIPANMYDGIGPRPQPQEIKLTIKGIYETADSLGNAIIKKVVSALKIMMMRG